MSLWHRLKVRLGLEDDFEDYDDYYDDDEYEAERPAARPQYGADSTSVKRLQREPDMDRARITPIRSVSDSRDYGRDSSRDYGRDSSRQQSPVAPAQVKMHIVEPRSFGEAQTIGDKIKNGTPVIMNLTSSDAELSKRLLDFAAGLSYGLDGGLQKVSEKVFMLTPANVDVSAEDRRRLKDKGLFSVD